jgi:predicted nucleotidyltransferase
MTDFEKLLRLLTKSRVEFIIVGGAAATVHGASRLTQDLDVVYGRTPGNLRRLVSALARLKPALRGAPRGLPFRLDVETLERGLNFTLSTSLGDLDLLGEIVGGGGYDQLLPDCIRIRVFGVECLCLGLDRLIIVKRASGRPRDLETVAELEALRSEIGRKRR